MKYAVVTTFHEAGYDQYASRMIDTFLANWPAAVDLIVYAQDCVVSQSADNLTVRDLHSTIPELVEFKNRWGNDPRARGEVATGPMDAKGKAPGLGFRWDAIRFSHKVFALWHAQANMPTGASSMVWLDADTLTHSNVPEDFLARIAPETFNKTGIGGPYGISYLGRSRYYTECGFVSYNLRHPSMGSFWEMFVGLYNNDGLFTLQEWHDSFIFDHCRRIFENRGMINHNITPRIIKGHPFINSNLGLYMDHLKGARKRRGRSEKNERTIRSLVKVDYWS